MLGSNRNGCLAHIETTLADTFILAKIHPIKCNRLPIGFIFGYNKGISRFSANNGRLQKCLPPENFQMSTLSEIHFLKCAKEIRSDSEYFVFVQNPHEKTHTIFIPTVLAFVYMKPDTTNRWGHLLENAGSLTREILITCIMLYSIFEFIVNIQLVFWSWKILP